MKHTILTVLLTLGVVGGLFSGFHHRRAHHRAQIKDEIADICVRAALRHADSGSNTVVSSARGATVVP